MHIPQPAVGGDQVPRRAVGGGLRVRPDLSVRLPDAEFAWRPAIRSAAAG